MGMDGNGMIFNSYNGWDEFLYLFLLFSQPYPAMRLVMVSARRGVALQSVEQLQRFVYFFLTKRREWGNGMIFNSYYGSFLHSLLSTGKFFP